MNKNILITLTSPESKRLIAKAVAALPEVKDAFRNGIVSLQLSTSCAYIYEELAGKSINRSNYVCGYIHEGGGCSAYLPGIIKREVYFEKGEEKYINFPLGDFDALYSRMKDTDILIKSGNVLGNDGKVGVFVGEPGGGGGEYGKAYPYLQKHRFRLIVPMTLNKSAHVNLEDVIDDVEIEKIDFNRTHVITGMLPLPGLVITEIDALKSLADVDAKPVAMNGVGSGGEGTVTLLLKGTKRALVDAWELTLSIKGEPQLEVMQRCGKCLAVDNRGICMAQVRTHK